MDPRHLLLVAATADDTIGSIASEEAVPGPTLIFDQSVDVGDIESEEAVPGVEFPQTIEVGSIASEETVDGPRIFEPLLLVPRSIGSGEVVVGPRTITVIGTPADPVYTPAISAEAYDRDGNLVAELDNSEARTWLKRFNDTGTGSLILPNDDGDLTLINYGHVIRFLIDGIARFAVLVEQRTVVEISPSEEVEEETMLAGRGLLAIFEEAVIEPPLGVDRASFTDQRIFNFASPDLDDSSWPSAIVTPTWYDDSLGNPITPIPATKPSAWPDDTAEWIWDRDSGSNGVPAGDAFLRHEFTVADDVVAEIWAAADDAYELWLDGVKIFEDGFDVGYLGQSKHVRVTLDAGTHYLAARARNLNNLKAGFLNTVLELDETGVPTGTVITNSGADWKIVAYVDPPGFTPGQVVRILVEEAIARGTIPMVLLSFDDFVDSNGDPWPVTGDISFQVGIDLYSALRQLIETYFDVNMAIGSFTLYAYASAGTVTGVSLEQGVNVTGLTHQGVA